MLWTKSFIPTLKETPQEAESVSHQLMLRAGLIRMLVSGVYSYLPLGLRVLNNICRLLRREMEGVGAAELLLPALQPIDLWTRSGREKDIADIMIRFVDRRGRNICLGPTHEEVITDLVRSTVNSYRQLPVVLYQIQTKYRDEIRPRFGVVRSCEFIMKDAYSFDRDEEGLEKNYRNMYEAYLRIFASCGLKVMAVEADSGVMGGKVSHEFMVPAASGEDSVFCCPCCAKTYPASGEERKCPSCGAEMKKHGTLEIGHIFKLGTKYSAALGANFTDEDGKQHPIIMGCYGIGVSRLMAAVIEQNHDQAGIVWPGQISPYKVVISALDMTNPVIAAKAGEVYNDLSSRGVEVILDDRQERAGVKFKDAELLGFPLQIIVGKEAAGSGRLELKARGSSEKLLAGKEEIYKRVLDS